eukprot:TRINITY_DN124_c1_g2_i1.p1 TRINITY_DN124_c1_g2~~TRINITY_DN124_c1_g2_i1.p1  ORF type:complete len:752 (+),score=219.22 TRINITY_DN124_c1_g2_i1:36-2291(+)
MSEDQGFLLLRLNEQKHSTLLEKRLSKILDEYQFIRDNIPRDRDENSVINLLIQHLEDELRRNLIPIPDKSTDFETLEDLDVAEIQTNLNHILTLSQSSDDVSQEIKSLLDILLQKESAVNSFNSINGITLILETMEKLSGLTPRVDFLTFVSAISSIEQCRIQLKEKLKPNKLFAWAMSDSFTVSELSLNILSNYFYDEDIRKCVKISEALGPIFRLLKKQLQSTSGFSAIFTTSTATMLASITSSAGIPLTGSNGAIRNSQNTVQSSQQQSSVLGISGASGGSGGTGGTGSTGGTGGTGGAGGGLVNSPSALSLAAAGSVLSASSIPKIEKKSSLPFKYSNVEADAGSVSGGLGAAVLSKNSDGELPKTSVSESSNTNAITNNVSNAASTSTSSQTENPDKQEIQALEAKMNSINRQALQCLNCLANLSALDEDYRCSISVTKEIVECIIHMLNSTSEEIQVRSLWTLSNLASSRFERPDILEIVKNNNFLFSTNNEIIFHTVRLIHNFAAFDILSHQILLRNENFYQDLVIMLRTREELRNHHHHHHHHHQQPQQRPLRSHTVARSQFTNQEFSSILEEVTRAVSAFISKDIVDIEDKIENVSLTEELLLIMLDFVHLKGKHYNSKLATQAAWCIAYMVCQSQHYAGKLIALEDIGLHRIVLLFVDESAPQEARLACLWCLAGVSELESSWVKFRELEVIKHLVSLMLSTKEDHRIPAAKSLANLSKDGKNKQLIQNLYIKLGTKLTS